MICVAKTTWSKKEQSQRITTYKVTGIKTMFCWHQVPHTEKGAKAI